MWGFYVKKCLSNELRRTFKTYKSSKVSASSTAQPNPTFPHAATSARKLHTSAAFKARSFVDAENLYAHSIIQLIPVTNGEIFPTTAPNRTITTLEDFNQILDQNFRDKSAEEITDAFRSVLDFCLEHKVAVSDRRFDKLVDGLMDHVQDLSDADLSDLLTLLSRFPPCDSYSSHNFHDMWSALDDVCCWRLANWTNEARFVFAEHWYRLNLGKFSDYVFKFIDRMNHQLKVFSKDELVHLFFYLRAHKRHKMSFAHHQAFDDYVGEMALGEIAVVAMVFARSQTKIKLQATGEAMIRKLKQEVATADEICVSRVLEVRKRCKYTISFVEKLSEEPQNLTKPQLIHTFFYMNICRTHFVDSQYESALLKHIHKLTADEMAIIAMGFFKTQSRVRLKFLLAPMIEQTKQESRTVHEITLTAILKVLRYSSHVLLVDQLMDLLDHLVPEIDRLSNVCCIHIALLGTTLQFFHEKSLEKVTQKIVGDLADVSRVRLKDMERLLVALTMFGFVPKTSPDVFDAVYEEIHKEGRREEFVRYKRCLPSILNLLSMRKMYSYKLMDQVLNMDSVIELYGKNAKLLPRDIFSLDVCIDVECPDYNGYRLDEAYRRKAAKWKVEYTPTWDQFKKISAAEKFILEVTDTVTKIVHGRQNLRTEHVLPNYVKSVIVICMDDQGIYVPPNGFDSYVLGDVMRAPSNSKLQWLAVVPVSWNNAIRNTSKPLGLIDVKCRLLRAIGYEPILVIWNEFLPLPDKERVDYIRNKIK